MKWVASVSCFLVGLDCLQKAFGESPQNLFASNALWVWFIPAIGWGCWMVVFALKKDY